MTKILGVFDLVPGWVYAICLAVIGLAWGLDHNTMSGRLLGAEREGVRIQGAFDAYRMKQEEASRIASENARKKESALQASADKDRREKNLEITRITAERDAAIGELRRRPKRPAGTAAAPGLPTPAGNGQAVSGCSGPELYREDAEFLVREAARADIIRQELQSCHAGYDRAAGIGAQSGQPDRPQEVNQDSTDGAK